MLCSYVPKNVLTTKIYTIKDLVMMDTSVSDFHTTFYIPEIKI